MKITNTTNLECKKESYREGKAKQWMEDTSTYSMITPSVKCTVCDNDLHKLVTSFNRELNFTGIVAKLDQLRSDHKHPVGQL